MNEWVLSIDSINLAQIIEGYFYCFCLQLLMICSLFRLLECIDEC